MGISGFSCKIRESLNEAVDELMGIRQFMEGILHNMENAGEINRSMYRSIADLSREDESTSAGLFPE